MDKKKSDDDNNESFFLQKEDFAIKKQIGKGRFSKVFLIETKKNQQFYAMKESNHSLDNTETKTFFQREYQICKKMNHPNIIKVYHYVENNNDQYENEITNEQGKKIRIYMEYIHGKNLSEYLKEKEEKKFLNKRHGK